MSPSQEECIIRCGVCAADPSAPEDSVMARRCIGAVQDLGWSCAIGKDKRIIWHFGEVAVVEEHRYCVECGTELKPRQTKMCSRSCRSIYGCKQKEIKRARGRMEA